MLFGEADAEHSVIERGLDLVAVDLVAEREAVAWLAGFFAFVLEEESLIFDFQAEVGFGDAGVVEFEGPTGFVLEDPKARRGSCHVTETGVKEAAEFAEPRTAVSEVVW